MNQPDLPADILNLPVPERIELVSKIWDSIAQDSLPPMTEADRKLIRERLDEHRADPDSGITLDELRSELNGD